MDENQEQVLEVLTLDGLVTLLSGLQQKYTLKSENKTYEFMIEDGVLILSAK